MPRFRPGRPARRFEARSIHTLMEPTPKGEGNAMPTRRQGDIDELTPLNSTATQVLSVQEERRLLQELTACKARLQDALDRLPRQPGTDESLDLAQYVAATCAGADPETGARLGVVFQRYAQMRSRLAMANLRLVAYVARGFRDRGIPHADLMQEGFCGLLEAIDRFDLTHDTKLATYATWWIRQSMQKAVAAGAYPVRLNPRHLRQLAQNQGEAEPSRNDPDAPDAPELIQHIRNATRPSISLNAALDADGQFCLLQTMRDPTDHATDAVDTDETLQRLLGTLRPREQQVLALRFGLGGNPRLSLSQVGKTLAVSKERVRQIQDRALAKLRLVVADLGLEDPLLTA